MATHLVDSQEVDRFLVPPLGIEGGSWPSTTTEDALTQQSLVPPSSCRNGNFSFSPMDASANQSWGPSINPTASSSFSTYSSDSDGLEPLPSLPGSSLEWSSSEEAFPASSVSAQETESLSAVIPSFN